jgi:type I restriction enzyme R subunit
MTAGAGQMNKRKLTETDIRSKFITPAIRRAGWDDALQIREEVYFTRGRIIVRGRLVARGRPKKADYVLYYKPNIPIAIIEAKDNNHSAGDGMQQALDYAGTMNISRLIEDSGEFPCISWSGGFRWAHDSRPLSQQRGSQ